MARPKGSKNKPKVNTLKLIEYLDVDKLVIDGTNIRNEIWDANPEFIADVKTNEVSNPLLVRPLKDGRYGVVAGSRRFNAVIDAGKDKVPCVIEDLDDLHALAKSFTENYNRKGIPCWMYFKQIGKMYSLLVAERPTSSKNDLMLELEKITGKSRTNIQTIIDMQTNLTEESKELLREPSEMTKETREHTYKYLAHGTSKPIDTHTAQSLGQIKDPERQFETGVRASELPQTKALEFVRKVRDSPNPKESIVKLFNITKDKVVVAKIFEEPKPTCSTKVEQVEEEETPAIVHPSKNAKPFDAYAEFKNNYCEALQQVCLDCPDKKTCKNPCKYTLSKKPKLEVGTVESEYVTVKSGKSTVAYKKKT